ncbi:hypothetical protein Pnap_4221 (plasmid) [Polaromonas naphthalenivorans CJ2]|uniref:ISXO2-like transposase domain-containing protein n=1 Tax=Polaromonas naphthalenivorans (strain CJ2) TaxID=365044 RepID=A1VV26_POLNA|nr:hypothetical protein Pnap_4221 [Polaromonas naphthalenivorans CJ2]
MEAHEVLPGVHRVASLVKRWLLGTHQGSFSADHMQAYLDEFAFRFNRRGSRARGKLFYRLLEQSVAMIPSPFGTSSPTQTPQKRGKSDLSHPALAGLRLRRSTWKSTSAHGAAELPHLSGYPANLMALTCSSPLSSSNFSLRKVAHRVN